MSDSVPSVLNPHLLTQASSVWMMSATRPQQTECRWLAAVKFELRIHRHCSRTSHIPPMAATFNATMHLLLTWAQYAFNVSPTPTSSLLSILIPESTRAVFVWSSEIQTPPCILPVTVLSAPHPLMSRYNWSSSLFVPHVSWNVKESQNFMCVRPCGRATLRAPSTVKPCSIYGTGFQAVARRGTFIGTGKVRDCIVASRIWVTRTLVFGHKLRSNFSTFVLPQRLSST